MEVEKVDPKIKKLIFSLLVLFVITNLMVQAFVTVSPLIAKSFKISASMSSIQSTISTVILGVGSVIFGTLSDYVSPRKLLLYGIGFISVGSIIGIIFQRFYFIIILARAFQSLGQATISALFLVIVSRYVSGKAKVKYFAWFTGCFQLAQSAGVLIGGIITTYIPWQVILLLPACSLIFVPIVLRCAPNNQSTKEKVDYIGLILFSVTIVCSLLFVNNLKLSYLIAMLIFLVIFYLYISKNKRAFITPDFFKNNKSFCLALLITICIYCGQFAFSFITTFIVSYGYHQSLSNVSYIFLPAYIASALAGCVGGDHFLKILGQNKAILLGMTMMAGGFLVAGIFVNFGNLFLSIGAILFFVGNTIMYSPLLNIVTGVLPKNEVGRGVGMNDLSINVSGSLGVAISGKVISLKALDAINIFHANGGLITYQNLFIIFGIIAVFAIALYVECQRRFQQAII